MKKVLAKIVDVKPDEIRALWLGFVFNFMVLGSYYVIKPVRDDIGAHNGVQNLWWMFTGTLLVALVANTAFSAIVARMSRRHFIPIAYRLFIFILVTSASLLEAAGWCVRFFPADFQGDRRERQLLPDENCRASVSDAGADEGGISQKRPTKEEAAAENPIGGGNITGISHVFR